MNYLSNYIHPQNYRILSPIEIIEVLDPILERISQLIPIIDSQNKYYQELREVARTDSNPGIEWEMDRLHYHLENCEKELRIYQMTAYHLHSGLKKDEPFYYPCRPR